MKAIALVLFAAALVPAAGPGVSFVPRTAAPGDVLTVRLARDRAGDKRVSLRSVDGARTTLRVVGRGSPRLIHATVPNVVAGRYRVELLRGQRVVATAGRTLRIVEAPPAERSCEESVYGELPPGWERNAVLAGPLALAGAAAAPEPRRGRGGPAYYEPIKFVLVLENGVDATLRVAAGDRPYVALLYARRGGLGAFTGSVRVADGTAAVALEGCPPSTAPHTQFNGGVVVAGPRCAHLEVHVRGRTAPYPLEVAFGRPC